MEFKNMETLEDWHTHNALCGHAKGALKDYVRHAISKGFRTIGFSEHYPNLFTEYLHKSLHKKVAMGFEQIKLYFADAKRIKEQFNSEIEIRIGLELDFSYSNNTTQLLNHKKDIDYLIAGIHVLKEKNILEADDQIWRMTNNQFVQKYYDNSIVDMTIDYFKQLQNKINHHEFDFDITAHFDVIKRVKKFKNNERVENEVIKTLEVIKKRRKVMEINTGGLREDINEMYPCERIIRIMHELDIPILLGSDAHQPEHVGFCFKKAIESLKEIGYNQLAHFRKRKISYLEI